MKTILQLNKKIFAAIAVLFTLSCNNQSQKNNTIDSITDSSKDQMTIQIPQSICYATKDSKDTIRLKVERFPNVVTGTLEYNIYEKDHSKGEIDGRLYGDTLIADYTFVAEGKKSIRQVAYLITDSLAKEGYADMEEKDGKMIFKNTAKLDFSKSVKLYTTACGQQ